MKNKKLWILIIFLILSVGGSFWIYKNSSIPTKLNVQELKRPSQLLLPDLYVESVKAEPQTIKVGETTKIHIRITNEGKKSTPEFKVSIKDQTGWGAVRTIKSLTPGGAVSFSQNIKADPVNEESLLANNPHIFTVWADSDEIVKEKNELNNTKSVQILVEPASKPEENINPRNYVISNDSGYNDLPKIALEWTDTAEDVQYEIRYHTLDTQVFNAYDYSMNFYTKQTTQGLTYYVSEEPVSEAYISAVNSWPIATVHSFIQEDSLNKFIVFATGNKMNEYALVATKNDKKAYARALRIYYNLPNEPEQPEPVKVSVNLGTGVQSQEVDPTYYRFPAVEFALQADNDAWLLSLTITGHLDEDGDGFDDGGRSGIDNGIDINQIIDFVELYDSTGNKLHPGSLEFDSNGKVTFSGSKTTLKKNTVKRIVPKIKLLPNTYKNETPDIIALSIEDSKDVSVSDINYNPAQITGTANTDKTVKVIVNEPPTLRISLKQPPNSQVLDQDPKYPISFIVDDPVGIQLSANKASEITITDLSLIFHFDEDGDGIFDDEGVTGFDNNINVNQVVEYAQLFDDKGNSLHQNRISPQSSGMAEFHGLNIKIPVNGSLILVPRIKLSYSTPFNLNPDSVAVSLSAENVQGLDSKSYLVKIKGSANTDKQTVVSVIP